MRVFLSYRRDDTAGRAGRLSDGLAERLGSSNVFQDVGSIAPGVDFENAVLRALDETDATIVVIGPDWATLEGSDRVPRLRQVGDYVRREVAAALASGRPVVPVLVGDARLPEPAELPDELAPLRKRQAISIRDAAWHEDVDSLVRRLRLEVNPRRSRRRLIWLAALGILIVLGATSAAIWSTRGDSSTSNNSIPACSVPDDSWTMLPLAAAQTSVLDPADGTSRKVGYTATGVAVKDRQPNWRILVDVKVSNDTAATDGNSGGKWYIDEADFHHLTIDGYAGGGAACFNLVAGAQDLPPGQRSVVRVGFDSTMDPRGVELLLETAGPPTLLVRGEA